MTELRVVADLNGKLSPISTALRFQEKIDKAILRARQANKRLMVSGRAPRYENIRVQEREVGEWRNRRTSAASIVSKHA
jgi:hypothetical protein